MKSTNENISYQEITEQNIILATSIELEIFPSMCSYLSYKNSLKKDSDTYYIVYYKGEICGITGLYIDERIKEENTIWMGWYGILSKFRKMGIGKQILLDTFEEARNRGYSTIRLYTASAICKDALFLYDKFMDLGEDYTLEEIELQRKVYSKSLSSQKPTAWNNKFLYLCDNTKEENEALKIFNDLKDKS